MTTANDTIDIAPLAYLVVLNWNGFEDTDECLRSLQRVTYPHFRILVVDNGSADDSPDRIAAAYPDIELVRCLQNRGIAAGYNHGIKAALARGADRVVVMNNDLVLDPAFLTEMVNAQATWPGCGVVMPKIYFYDPPDVIWSTGGRIRWIPSNILLRHRLKKDGPTNDTNTAIEFAPSACLLLTRAVCEQISFDESYFFYFDDWDFCIQVRDAGWRIIYAADAHLWHKVSQSTQNSPESQRWWRIMGQSCARYHRKHHGRPLLYTYVAWVLLRETIKGNVRSLPTFLGGVRAGLAAETVDDIQPGWSV